jgi:hypothetical protein
VTTAKTTPTTSTSGSIKWNPGHYMDSYSVIRQGVTISKVLSELNDLNNSDAILGFRVNITWSALEPQQGVYDFAVLDSILAKLKTAYNKPKRLVIYMWLYSNGAKGTDDSSVIPGYIQSSATYGTSPVSGSHGWWGRNANGASTGMYAPSLYYQPVMDRLISLVQAMGKHYDSDPYVEAIDFQENSTITQAAAFDGGNPLYSDDQWLTQQKRLLSATTAAFPHTNVVMDNSWFARPAGGVALQQWMVENRIAPGTADMWGQSSIESTGGSSLSDGIKTLLGINPNGGMVDLRPRTRAMLAIEAPDMFGTYFRSKGGPWTPLDIINAANQTYYASHLFWTRLAGNETSSGLAVPTEAKWSNLVQTVSAHPLTHTDYPANYP